MGGAAAIVDDGEPTIVEKVTGRPLGRGKIWNNIAVRLADEGVPVRAIVRALLLSYDEVVETLKGAAAQGTILSVPRDDWPPGTRRDERAPDTIPLEFEDDHMTMLAMRRIRLSPAMARMFIALLRRPEMTKNALHLCCQRDDAAERPEPTDIKIVDVFVCKIRKLLPVDIKIGTLWGRGYFIDAASKQRAYELLGVKNVNPAGAGNSGGSVQQPPAAGG